jgi:O-acetyl-ADP-ribose deacetylase (regulator of RNase III)
LFFKDDPDVECTAGDIFDVTADAIVSPANSFGFMDGGIDAVYSMRWPHIQKVLQEELLANHYGEMPVGSAVIVPTGDAAIPWCVSAPTMRVPMDIRGTVNAYLAFRAALIAVMRHNERCPQKIKSVLSPGMGTAVGMMPVTIAAMQMHHAYKLIVKNEGTQPATADDLGEAWHNHEILRRGVA